MKKFLGLIKIGHQSNKKIVEIYIDSNHSHKLLLQEFNSLFNELNMHYTSFPRFNFKSTFDPMNLTKHDWTYTTLFKIHSKENLYLLSPLSNQKIQINLTVEKEMTQFRMFGKYELMINYLNNNP
jgi:hypothetical protein